MAKKSDTAKASTKKTTAAKKTTAKKTAASKPAAKKTTTAKKTAAAKPAAKKTTTAKKTAAKNTTARKAEAPVVKKTTTKKVKGYGKKDLEEFKKLILEKREEIIEQLQNLKDQMMDPATGQYVNENSPYSLHMAEQGTDSQEREKLYLWAQRENKFLGYLEDALQRIDSGTYGLCLECIDEPKNLCPTCPLIPKERLKAVPHTQLCVQVKQQQDKKKF